MKVGDLLRDELAALCLPDLAGKTVPKHRRLGWFLDFRRRAGGRGPSRGLDKLAWSLDVTDPPTYVQRCPEAALPPGALGHGDRAWRPDGLPASAGSICPTR
ncbi:MAG: hypothetical protein QOK29_3061 [Rhodospirillaceae bacterium]|nr:hypothetical protein [Rhodospirillaceae bacterium]